MAGSRQLWQRLKKPAKAVEKTITIGKKGVAAFAAVEAEIPALKAEGEKLREQLAAATDDSKLDLRRDIDRIGGKIADLQSKGNHFKRLALQKLRHGIRLSCSLKRSLLVMPIAMVVTRASYALVSVRVTTLLLHFSSWSKQDFFS